MCGLVEPRLYLRPELALADRVAATCGWHEGARISIGLPRVSGAALLGAHVTVNVFSNSIGGRHAETAVASLPVMEDLEVVEVVLASSTRVFQRCRSGSSTCIRD